MNKVGIVVALDNVHRLVSQVSQTAKNCLYKQKIQNTFSLLVNGKLSCAIKTQIVPVPDINHDHYLAFSRQ